MVFWGKGEVVWCPLHDEFGFGSLRRWIHLSSWFPPPRRRVPFCSYFSARRKSLLFLSDLLLRRNAHTGASWFPPPRRRVPFCSYFSARRKSFSLLLPFLLHSLSPLPRSAASPLIQSHPSPPPPPLNVHVTSCLCSPLFYFLLLYIEPKPLYTLDILPGAPEILAPPVRFSLTS